MRGAIKYKRKEIILNTIFLVVYIIAFIYAVSEYVPKPFFSELLP